MKEAYQLAFQHSNERKIKPGDKVLIRNLSERKRKRETERESETETEREGWGTGKIRSYWEEQIDIIV